MQYRYPDNIQSQINAIDEKIDELLKVKARLIEMSVPTIIIHKNEFQRDEFERLQERMKG